MHVKTSKQIIKEIDRAILDSGRSDRSVQAAAGVSPAMLGYVRKRGGNMTTDNMLALTKTLGLRVRIEK